MKKKILFLVLIIWQIYVYADMIITRQEGMNTSKEIYARGQFAEVINDRVVSVWDFRNMTLTMVNYDIKSYTRISYDDFKKEIEKQTKAEIKKELSELDPDRKKQMAEATKALFARLVPRMDMIRDSIMIAGYPSLEYKVFNDTLLIQRIWISKKVKDDMMKEIPFESMKKVESIFKQKRKMKLDAMGLNVDSITQLVEMIEQNGYIMKRFDYGIRTKSNPKIYASVESVNNEITEISHMKVDDKVFSMPKGFKKLSYSQYQIKLIQYMEANE
ncbi:MAG TPA: hypothetical protein PKJ08_08940 [Candidatus Cloacimonadota bacterium]|nr:hypothetical protein [Candidatus Cloacimonadota bacterium]